MTERPKSDEGVRMTEKPTAEEIAREIALKASGVSPDEHPFATCNMKLLRAEIAAALAAAKAEPRGCTCSCFDCDQRGVHCHNVCDVPRGTPEASR
jgi:hypothetical protein